LIGARIGHEWCDFARLTVSDDLWANALKNNKNKSA